MRYCNIYGGYYLIYRAPYLLLLLVNVTAIKKTIYIVLVDTFMKYYVLLIPTFCWTFSGFQHSEL